VWIVRGFISPPTMAHISPGAWRWLDHVYLMIRAIDNGQ
jgi:hypothetical protein